MANIPKIIHQIWWQGMNKLPNKYKEYNKSWINKNKSWKIIYWDEYKIIQLLKKYYPDILKLLNNYEFMIQKIDVAKYVILYHYGGVYVDMDTVCEKSLDILINKKEFSKYSFICCNMEIVPFIKIINNGVIFSKKKHPILLVLLSNLGKSSVKRYYHNQDFYIMESTGPMIFDKIISEYEGKDVLVLPHDYLESCSMLDYPKCDKKGNYITHHHTLSWSTGYFKMIFIVFSIIRKYIILFVILAILIKLKIRK